MDDGVEILVAYRRQQPDPHALVVRAVEGRVDVVRPSVHGHVMPASRQADAQLLRERLEPAVAGGNPTGAEDRDSQPGILSRHPSPGPRC